jgi:dihydroorotase
MRTLTIRRPFNAHTHLREGPLLNAFVLADAAVFAYSTVMPNTKHPTIRTGAQAMTYKSQIQEAAHGYDFTPLMTIWIDENTSPEMVMAAKSLGVKAAKLYFGITTNAVDGMKDVRLLYRTFLALEMCDMPLLIHGEVSDDDTVDCIDAEETFIPILRQIARDFPKLKIVFEHITTEAAVHAVEELPDTVAATITVHHLFVTMNHMRKGKIRPDLFCLPEAKRIRDRKALRVAALSGNPKFFLGTDSAPHPRDAKICEEGCAGIFVPGIVALPLLAQLFDSYGLLDKLEDFTSTSGLAFYGIPRNTNSIKLVEVTWEPPGLWENNVHVFMPPLGNQPGTRQRALLWRVVT